MDRNKFTAQAKKNQEDREKQPKETSTAEYTLNQGVQILQEEQNKIKEEQRKKEEEEKKRKENAEKKLKEKKDIPEIPNISLKVNQEDKAKWTNFFKAYDLTLSQGIRRAVNYYIKQVIDGKIEL